MEIRNLKYSVKKLFKQKKGSYTIDLNKEAITRTRF